MFLELERSEFKRPVWLQDAKHCKAELWNKAEGAGTPNLQAGFFTAGFWGLPREPQTSKMNWYKEKPTGCWRLLLCLIKAQIPNSGHA